MKNSKNIYLIQCQFFDEFYKLELVNKDKL